VFPMGWRSVACRTKVIWGSVGGDRSFCTRKNGTVGGQNTPASISLKVIMKTRDLRVLCAINSQTKKEIMNFVKNTALLFNYGEKGEKTRRSGKRKEVFVKSNSEIINFVNINFYFKEKHDVL